MEMITQAAARTEDVIAAEINVIKASARDTMLKCAIEIGRRLVEAKAIVPYGAWGAWLKDNVSYTERTAQGLMGVYREYGGRITEKESELSYTKALALMGLTHDERADIEDRIDVDAASVRALKEEIARYREEHAAKQLTIDELMNAKLANARTIEDLTDEIHNVQSRAAQARDEAEQARAEAEQARAEAEQAKAAGADAQKAEARAEKLRADAQKSSDKLKKLESELKALKEKPPEVREVEVIKEIPATPPEVLAELNKLRAVAAKAPNEAIIRLRAGIEQLSNDLRAIDALIEAVKRENAEDAAKYARALCKLGENITRKFGGEAV